MWARRQHLLKIRTARKQIYVRTCVHRIIIESMGSTLICDSHAPEHLPRPRCWALFGYRHSICHVSCSRRRSPTHCYTLVVRLKGAAARLNSGVLSRLQPTLGGHLLPSGLFVESRRLCLNVRGHRLIFGLPADGLKIVLGAVKANAFAHHE